MRASYDFLVFISFHIPTVLLPVIIIQARITERIVATSPTIFAQLDPPLLAAWVK